MVDLNGLDLDGEGEVSSGEKYPNMPDGDYLCTLDKSEEKTKNQTYILFEFSVREGRYKGRKIWYLAFITGKTSGKGLGFIKKLKEVTNSEDATDTDDMNGIPLILTTELVEDTYKGNGKMKESICGLKKTDKKIKEEPKKVVNEEDDEFI